VKKVADLTMVLSQLFSAMMQFTVVFTPRGRKRAYWADDMTRHSNVTCYTAYIYTHRPLY